MSVWTYSKMNKFKVCRKQFDFAYNQRLKKVEEDKKLVIGRAVHRGLDRLYTGKSLQAVFDDVDAIFEDFAEGKFEEETEDQWLIKEKIKRILRGYEEIVLPGDKKNKDFQVLDTEPEFAMNFADEDGNNHVLKGKVDMVLETTNGIWLVEHKTAQQWSDSNNLKLDEQGTTYIVSAESALDEPVNGIMYNIIRKPSIRPRKNESNEEYLDRLVEDMHDRPEFYFFREESTRSTQQKRDLIDDLKHIAAIDEREDTRYYRNPSYLANNKCNWMCPFTDICIEYDDELVKMEYEKREKEHEELEDDTGDIFSL
jgi:hypothetical protein